MIKAGFEDGGRYRMSFGLSIRFLNNPFLFDPVLVDIFSTVAPSDTLSHALTFRRVNSIWSRQGNEILQGLTLPSFHNNYPFRNWEAGKVHECMHAWTKLLPIALAILAIASSLQMFKRKMKKNCQVLLLFPTQL